MYAMYGKQQQKYVTNLSKENSTGGKSINKKWLKSKGNILQKG